MASGQYQNVNGVKTLNLHGKNYVEVAERVHMVHEKKAVFSIVKSEPMNVADRWLWVAVIIVDNQQYIGNAEIKMNAPKNTPDGTNPFECGETSAIGRALAFAGFGSVESIASKDEIERGKPFSGTEQPDKSAQARTQPTPAAAKSAEQQPANGTQARVDAPPIERIMASANRVLGEGGYASLKGTVIGKHDLGDIADGDIPANIRFEMADMLREEAAKKPTAVGATSGK